MKITYNKAIEFNEAAKAWYRTQREETELSAAIDTMVERIRPHFEGKNGYNQRANSINRTTAVKDTKHKGAIVTNGYGQFQYTQSGLDKRDELMDVLGEELIDIETIECGEVKDLTLEQRKIFSNVIKFNKATIPILTLEPQN